MAHLSSSAGHRPLRESFIGFCAGAIAVLIFHQGMLMVLHATGVSSRGAFPMNPTEPFGVPQVISLAFWGGVWGIIFVHVVPRIRVRGAGYWLAALAFGAILPTLVAWFIVAPLKRQPIGGGWQPLGMLTGLLVNGAWGLGTALLISLAHRGRRWPSQN